MEVGSPPDRRFALLGQPGEEQTLGQTPCLGGLQEREPPVPCMPPLLESTAGSPGRQGCARAAAAPVLPRPSRAAPQELWGAGAQPEHTGSSQFSRSLLEAPLPAVPGAEPCCLSPAVAAFTSSCHLHVPVGPGRSTGSISGPFLPMPRWHLSEAAMATLLLHMASKPIQGTER